MPSIFELDYFFWVVALGTMLLGLASGIIGSTIVLEEQSQLGDAIGHSVYPGVIIAFMIFQTRHSLVLLTGALLAGIFAFYLIEFIRKHSNFAYESILALVLSSMFSLGLLLYKIVQSHARFQTVNFAGLDNYIFGQAAFIRRNDVQVMGMVALIIIIVFLIFYPQIKRYLFDKIFSRAIGINTNLINYVLLFLALLCIVVGLQAVGAKLISSMLVAPAVAASLWTDKYHIMVILSGLFGLVAGFIGTYFSTYIPDLATGPTIVVVLTLIALISLVIAPKGIFNLSFFKKRGA